MAEPLSVLIVEDSENDTRLLVRELERAGYAASWERVETAGSMRAALEGRSWDLIIADYTMPKFSAPAALALLQDMGLDLPFIIVSGSVGEDTAVEAMRAGAHDYLLKGNLKRLFPAVQRELEQAGQRRARRKAEEQYRFLFENGPHPMWVVDRETLAFLAVNDAALRQYGYTRGEFLAMRVTDIRPPEEIPAFLEAIPGIAAGVERTIWKDRRKDGSIIHVEATTHPLTFDGRRAWLALAYDVTDRLRAEEAMRRSEKRYRRLFDSNTIGIVVADVTGRTLEANEAYLAMVGYTGEELLSGRIRWNEMTPAEYRERDQVAVEQLRRTGVAPAWEKELLRKDGSRVSVLIGVAMLEESEGTVIAYVVDLTERKRAEESIQKLLLAVEQAENIIFMTDPDGKITYVNPAFETTYGFARGEALGQNPRILKSGHHDEAFYRNLWQTLQSGRGFRAEIVNRARDGRTVTVEEYANPVFDSEGRRIGFIAVQHDTTQRKLLEEQLRQAQKMEAIGQLAGGVAHDFNNLLTAILGYADVLATETGPESSLSGSIEEIRKAGERAANLTRQLLAFSRRQLLEPKVLNLNALVENIEKMLRRLIGEDVELVTVLDPRLGHVRADAGQIEQVIMNLVVNARDAMPRGGTLTIETRDVELDETYSREHLVSGPAGSYVMLAVSDTGVGMSAETKSHMFEPFFTTKGAGRGTGLGLATVYGIVKQSNGYVWVYSELDRGTAFKIYLPRVEEGLEPAGAAATRARPSRGSETILLVEDEESVRALVRKILQSLGYDVLEAHNGEQALKIARQHPGAIDLVVSDLVMPEMGGVDLVSRLRKLRPGIRVLYMSGYTDDAVVRQGFLDSASAFLQKPFAPAALAEKVREVLER
jgi:two-component system cell cycle sensor histidine kinase/response regulator CckA